MAVYFFDRHRHCSSRVLAAEARSLGVTDIGTIGRYAAVPNDVALSAIIVIGAMTDRM
ncbi:hypothetical protein [Paraburkholderia terrae]|uniref:hypothetical protein n=1 Tax=Paraburkholderia terrae TaxID=311230 RepID=UPI00296B0FA9|nr:hypothetical protein [Paraburkholderia terrae]MDW3662861.1 hypothetical protein [Paraburkholderia terrae]